MEPAGCRDGNGFKKGVKNGSVNGSDLKQEAYGDSDDELRVFKRIDFVDGFGKGAGGKNIKKRAGGNKSEGHGLRINETVGSFKRVDE